MDRPNASLHPALRTPNVELKNRQAVSWRCEVTAASATGSGLLGASAARDAKVARVMSASGRGLGTAPRASRAAAKFERRHASSSRRCCLRRHHDGSLFGTTLAVCTVTFFEERCCFFPRKKKTKSPERASRWGQRYIYRQRYTRRYGSRRCGEFARALSRRTGYDVRVTTRTRRDRRGNDRRRSRRTRRKHIGQVVL